jgi:hypothetical protein
VKLVEPPSCSSKIVLIGKNSRGCWVAQEQNGLYGGLFVSRADAVRYALFENGHHPEAIVSTPGILELDMGRSASSSHSAWTDSEDSFHRRAA